MTNDISHYTEQNRRAWSEIAEVRSKSRKPAHFFVQGGTTLDEHELAVAGNVTGRSLLHLQCATGEDTLSWAVAGAKATGVDISEAQIVLAQQKAREAGLVVLFIAADVYALPAHLQQSSFDYVYTGGGAIVWLPDLDRWAHVIASALKPNGRFILFEEHPVAQCLWVTNGKLQLEGDYFGRNKPDYVSPGWSHFKGGENATETKVEFSWPLGDVVTVLAQAGLQIESLQEFPSDAEYRFGDALDEVRRFPGKYLLVARKSAF